MRKDKFVYYGSTGLLSLMMLFSASMYFFNNSMAVEAFMALGYPTYLIYPLACAKILGVITLWVKNFSLLKEWVYVAFFFNIILGLGAHIAVGDGQFIGALLGLVFWTVSYVSFRKRK